MTATLELLIAAALDVASGDPGDRFHPVWWLGRLISRLENVAYRLDDGYLGGAALTVATVTLAMLCVATFLNLAGRTGKIARLLGGAAVLYSSISLRTLTRTALEIERLLDEGRLEEARTKLHALVGRDTDDLTPDEVARATVESVAENASDGVVAPFFFAAAGGPLLAAGYRTVNTLDSMVGYENDRYRHFGTASARTDDALNFVPARLTAAAMLCAGMLQGRDCRRALEVMRRDARKHRSPNAGWPEATMAGLLGVRLGGINRYGGREVAVASLGDDLEPVRAATIGEAARLVTATCAISLVAACLTRVIALWCLR